MAHIEFHKPSITLPETKKIKSIAGDEYLNDYKRRMQVSKKIAIEKHKTSIKLGNKLLNGRTEQDRVHLVIGDDIPQNAPSEFNFVSLYIRDDNNKLQLYADISLPYLINHSEILNIIEDDPCYIFQEKYDKETQISRYTCMVKPFGDKKGVYRLGLGSPIKIMDLELSSESYSIEKKKTLTKKL